ncbi:MAG: histidine phosphatase family protein [Alphaproteobacteria bacterium]|nr:histidine phosphatase family protein [Alphaproteobacteria bacterium]MDE2112703.1 histidine phosphatase family protein [Alphaproteobacteria bacterium]MDE2494734.1 histidine phosphatase family protein [Alphaproteobacteria bacterium]
MSAPAIYFLRHGETESGARYWGRTDIAPNTHGLQQMRDATAGLGIDHIVTSPLQRCRTFASELSACGGRPVTVEPRFAEMDFGRWNGRTAADILNDDEDILHNFWQDPVRNAPPGGETLDELAARVRAACRGLVQNIAYRKILVVTHGGPIRVLLCLLRSLPIERALTVDVPHASLHRIDVGHLTRLCAASDPA